MLNLNSIMLNSEDYKKLGAYYGEVLQKKSEMQDEKIGIIGYLAGNCFISIMSHDKVHGSSLNPERIIFSFEAIDVEGEFNRVKAIQGTTVIKEPYHPGDQQDYTIATLADPDGNYFQLVTPWGSNS